MRRPAAPLAPSDPAVDVDLDAMLAAELPPCEVKTWFRRQSKPPPCGRPSAGVITLTCTPCGPRPKSCCAKHLREFYRRQWLGDLLRTPLWQCGTCGDYMRIRSLS